MAILINAHQISKSFSLKVLFSGITFSIGSGDRIGLIGPNGAGKSTLLKILAGRSTPDEGTLSVQRGLRIGYLEQIPQFTEGATVLSTVMEGTSDPHDWENTARAQEVMSKLSLTGASATEGVGPDTSVSKLSGGWKKRVALARELLRQPDLLLLDEPTNHLDIESILWLEELIAQSDFATLTITHDRVFLQRVSNRIMELNKRLPAGLLSIDGDYAHYLELKESLLSAQEQEEAKKRNTLRRETEWLRRGAKARIKKQQARIQGAAALKDTVETLSKRNQDATVRFDFQSLEKNPKKLIEAKGVSKFYGSHLVIPKMDLLITPKSRIGLLGPNGCGKSTLIRLLLGSETPDSGNVARADQLKVAYFEQDRESLDPQVTVSQALCSSGEYVDFRGVKVHVRGYLSRFLFTSEQMSLPVTKLSGGEQSRLLIARLMLTTANVLILDEPTNDLDLATLDVLEEVLKEFDGAVILVSHDRYFLDQTAPQIVAFGCDRNGKKEVVRLVGIEQWEAWHDDQVQREVKKLPMDDLKKDSTRESDAAALSSTKKKKLGYKDQRELDQMESMIEKAEAKLSVLVAESHKPENISNAAKLLELTREMASAQAEVDRLYARWSELES